MSKEKRMLLRFTLALTCLAFAQKSNLNCINLILYTLPFQKAAVLFLLMQAAFYCTVCCPDEGHVMHVPFCCCFFESSK